MRGLNPEFEGRRAALFHQANLPSLEEAIAAMAQEETRLKVIKGNTLNSPSLAYMVAGSQETRICYEKGHLIRDCSQPLKPNRDRGRGRGMQRGGTSRGGASRGGRVNFRANHAMSDGYDAELVTISPNELDEFRRWKEIRKDSQLNNQETTSSSNSVADAVHSDSGTFNQNHTSDWILDSGASRHVMGKLNEFTSYTPYSHSYKGTIKTADGTPCSIRGIGTVQCTPSITLSSVLHVPSFPVNLISISSLIDQMDCRVLLDRENCLI